MTKTWVRVLSIAGVFVVLGFLAIGFWAVNERAKLRDPVARAGHESARAILAYAMSHGPGLWEEGDLDRLVAERGLVGALLVDEQGLVVARGGALDSPVEEAALDGVSPMPPEKKGQLSSASRTVALRILFRESEGGYTVVVVEDLRGIEAVWKRRRGRAVIAAMITVMFSPLLGYLLVRYLAARRRQATA